MKLRFDEKLSRWRNGEPALYYRTVGDKSTFVGHVTIIKWDVHCDCDNLNCYYKADYLFKVQDDQTGEIYENVRSDELDWLDIVDAKTYVS